MSRYDREFQPTDADCNERFLREYVHRTTMPAPSDGRIPDPDSTLSRFLRWRVDGLFPPVHTTDATIRVGLAWHAAFVSVALRNSIEFTLPYAVCLIFSLYDRELFYRVAAWSIGACLLLAVFRDFARKDSTLFFHQATAQVPSIALLALVVLMMSEDLGRALLGIAFGFAIGCLGPFSVQGTAAAAARRGFHMALVTLLVFVLTSIRQRSSLWPLEGLLFFSANFGLLLPVVLACQEWFAANRYASLADLRLYRPHGVSNRIDLRLILGSLWVVTLGLLSALVCSACLQRLVFELQNRTTSAADLLDPLIKLSFGLLSIALLNSILTQVVYQRRVPHIGKFLESYFSAWRLLAAWLSYEAPTQHPAAFQFGRPWTRLTTRMALVGIALAVNSAITLGMIVSCSRTYLSRQADSPIEYPTDRVSFAATSIRENSHVSVGAIRGSSYDAAGVPSGRSGPPSGAFSALNDTRMRKSGFWLLAVLASVVTPPLLLFLTFHAAWGPTIVAYSDFFDCFDERFPPPLLHISLASALRRLLER